jgi:hypothetical protein
VQLQQAIAEGMAVVIRKGLQDLNMKKNTLENMGK